MKIKNKNDYMNKLLKVLIIFFIYLIYNYVFSKIGDFLHINNQILINFLADIFFFILIVCLYRQNIKKDLKKLKTKKYQGKIIKKVLFGVLLIFILNVVMGILTEVLVPNLPFDSNRILTQRLFSVSNIYTIFKTMVFASIAEELLFRESINDVISNKILFIIISSLIYTVFNFIYVGFNDNYLFAHFLVYLLPALLLSYLYIKNDSNIVILILIKFFYNLIPLTILLLGI